MESLRMDTTEADQKCKHTQVVPVRPAAYQTRRSRAVPSVLIALGLGMVVTVAQAGMQCTGEHRPSTGGSYYDTYDEAMAKCQADIQQKIADFGGQPSASDPNVYVSQSADGQLVWYLRTNSCTEDLDHPITSDGTWFSGWINWTSQSGHAPAEQPGQVEWDSYVKKEFLGSWECKPRQFNEQDPAKELGEPSSDSAVGDPIDTATGNVYRHDTDLSVGRWLRFERFYNSDAAATGSALGPRWTHSYSRQVRYQPSPGINQPSVATIIRDDGKALTFATLGPLARWSSESDTTDTLSWTLNAQDQPTGWTLTRYADGSVETYNGDGRLTKITTSDGYTLTLSYQTANSRQLAQISDPQGRVLRVSYDAQGRLQSVTQPDDSAVTYAYNDQGQLQRVTLPGGEQRVYAYDEVNHNGGAGMAHRLTGVLDGQGVRRVTYDYQADGRAIGTAFAEGSQAYRVQYHDDGSTTLTDPLGAQATRRYGTWVGVRQVTALSGLHQDSGTTAAWSYDDLGQLTSRTDFNGRRTLYEYNDERLEIARTEAAGTGDERRTTRTWSTGLSAPLQTEERLYDAGRQLIAQRRWAYLMDRKPTAVCDSDPAQPAAIAWACHSASDDIIMGAPPPGVQRTSYAYCIMAMPFLGCPIAGLLQTVTAPGGAVTTYNYYTSTDESGCGTAGGACNRLGDLKTITNAAGQVITFVSYDKNGHLTRQRDPNNVVTDYSYTPRGQLLTRIVRANADGSPSANDATTQLAYDDASNLTRLTDPDGVTLTFTYDAARRLTGITDALGNRLHYVYDAAGNKTKEETFDASGILRRSLARSYNTLGQLASVQDGLGHTVFNAGLADSYDANGNLVRSADALGIQRQQGYDALNRLISTLDNAHGTDPATRDSQSVLAFDAADRLLGISDPDALNTTYERDGLGNLTALTSPDTGTTRASYDVGGNLLTQTDAKGITATHTYDVLNRRLTTNYPDSTQNITYKYDETNTATGCSASYPVGRLTRIVENAVTTIYCYDAFGRVTEKRQTQGSHTDITLYGYTKAGRVASVRTPAGIQLTYARDAAGRISAISSDHGPVVSSVSYLPFGPVSRYTLGNGQTVTRTYDANYQFTDISSPAFTLHVSRDAMGRVTALGDSQGANPATETYAYDPLERLTTVRAADGSALTSLTYTKTGDRLSKAGSGLATGAYSYNTGTHQLIATGNAARSVDANGNTTAVNDAGSTYGFGYNDRNRVAMVQQGGSTIAAYGYNALNQRVQKTVNGTATRFMYDEASQLIGEYGSESREYIWMDDVPVAVIDISGGTSAVNYITTDGLNTPRAVSNSQGQTIWQWAYANNAWGEQAPISNGYVFNLRFPGQYYDAESGLLYNVNRDYDSATGRYRQSDPLGLAAGYNTYAYVGGDPLSASDPLGLKKFPAVILEGGFGIGAGNLAGGTILVVDPLNSSQVHQFAYTSGGVGLGIPFSSYGSAQIAVIDADSMRDITGLGWYAGGALAAGASGTAGTYSAPFWFQDSSYKITSVGYAAGAAGGVSTGITYTWNLGSTDFANLPGMTIDALRKATQQVDGCK